MPTPNLSRDQRRSIAELFAAEAAAPFPFLDQRPPRLGGAALEEALALFDHLQCLRCHLLSNAPRLEPGELSPDLALSGERLRREWIGRFILEPQRVMAGTKMPTLFPLEDEDDPASRVTPVPEFFGGVIARQIEALTDLSLWWGSPAAASRRCGDPRHEPVVGGTARR
jgi:hypothetical protein